MPVGFGAEPIKNGSGVVTSGTTDADIRKIYGGLFTPGLITGGLVTTNASNTTYAVSAGVGAFKMANNEIVLGPIPAQTALSPSGIAGNTHVVYAQQNTASADGNNEVVVRVAATLPAIRAIRLATFTVPAGAANSNQYVRTGNVDYSIPYGASLGVVAYGEDTLNGSFSTEQTVVTRNFYLPSDRQLNFSLHTVVSAVNAVGFDNARYCEASYKVFLDNQQIAHFGTPGLHQAWAWLNWNQTWPASQGNHTVRLTRMRQSGPGTPQQWYGHGNAIGLRFKVFDEGVVV